MNRKLLIALIGALIVCLCLTLAGTSAFGVYLASAPRPTATVTRPTRPVINEALTPVIVPTIPPPRTNAPVVVASPTASPIATPLASVSNVTALALQNTLIPSRDLFQIVPRLQKNLTLLTPVPTSAPRVRRVGDKDKFFVTEDMTTGKYRTANATLQIIGARGYFWVEDGMSFDQAALKRSADVFDAKVYPTNEKYFGSPRTGLDGDARIHVLNSKFPDAAGYFSSVDLHPTAFAPSSNQRNIIYMNIEAVKPGSDEYNGDLAHEFQHLIHSYQQRNATGWIDEGMGNLAIKVNGYSLGGVLDTFAKEPNTQLNTWAPGRDALPHYAASYLFFAYIADRFGPDAIRDVILAPREGTAAVQTMLDQRAGRMRFDDLFSDWAIANFINNSAIENGRYAHKTESSFHIARETVVNQYPDVRAVQQNQYAASYITLQPARGDVTFYFTGTTTTKLIAANAHAGKWMWYSNRADLANMTLTRPIDLSRATQGKATLQFWMWHDIEKDYDFGYVEVSTDGGKTWDTLPGKSTTNNNPSGANYGNGLTGKSGAADGAASAQWIQEQMDLSPYVGKNILLRFEYITDDAYNTPGWAIDDIAIPEIGFSDGVESGVSGWDVKGFVRTDNVLPQRYSVAIVEQAGTARVKRIPLDALNRGSYTVAGLGRDVSSATVIITTFAPTTTEPIEYQIGVAPK